MPEEEVETRRDKLWEELIGEKKHKFTDVLCHEDYMDKITNTVQSGSIDALVGKLDFISAFVLSPYAFSLSFLKDPSIVGKSDDFG
jgi:hypothetical protein